MKFFIFIFVLFSAVFALPEKYNFFSDEEKIKNLTQEANRIIQETADNMTNIPNDYENLISERVDCLTWEYNAQKLAVNKTIIDSVSKGMNKNKPLKNFQCITTAAKETYDKLDNIGNQIKENTEKIKKAAVGNALAYKLLMKGFKEYVDEIYKTKSEELKKAGNEAARKKIIEEVNQRMKFFKQIFIQINTNLDELKFKFFQEYINFAHNTENLLKKTEREGSQKIQKCIA